MVTIRAVSLVSVDVVARFQICRVNLLPYQLHSIFKFLLDLVHHFPFSPRALSDSLLTLKESNSAHSLADGRRHRAAGTYIDNPTT